MKVFARAGENFVEYYDILQAPWQLENQAASLQPLKRAALEMKLATLMECQGAAECAAAGQWLSMVA
jgi:hypothetical protein